MFKWDILHRVFASISKYHCFEGAILLKASVEKCTTSAVVGFHARILRKGSTTNPFPMSPKERVLLEQYAQFLDKNDNDVDSSWEIYKRQLL